MERIEIEPIGKVRRVNDDICELDVDPSYQDGLEGVGPGMKLDVLYWMHRLTAEQRQRKKVHPRGDAGRPLRGVFALRSPMRPNPIGVTQVLVTEVNGTRIRVRGLDAADGSPIVDLKASPSGTNRKREGRGQE